MELSVGDPLPVETDLTAIKRNRRKSVAGFTDQLQQALFGLMEPRIHIPNPWSSPICSVWSRGILIALSLSGDNSSDGFEGDGGVAASHCCSASFWSFGMAGFGLCGLLISLFNGDGTSLGSMLVAAGTGVGLGWRRQTLQVLDD